MAEKHEERRRPDGDDRRRARSRPLAPPRTRATAEDAATAEEAPAEEAPAEERRLLRLRPRSAEEAPRRPADASREARGQACRPAGRGRQARAAHARGARRRAPRAPRRQRQAAPRLPRQAEDQARRGARGRAGARGAARARARPGPPEGAPGRRRLRQGRQDDHRARSTWSAATGATTRSSALDVTLHAHDERNDAHEGDTVRVVGVPADVAHQALAAGRSAGACQVIQNETRLQASPTTPARARSSASA